MNDQELKFKLIGYDGDKKEKYRKFKPSYSWKVILPQNIYERLIEYLENDPPDFLFNQDTGLYYLSLIASVKSMKKDKVYYEGYVNLPSTWLKKINYNYKKYFTYFEKIGIVQTNEKYSNGADPFTKSYRYNYDYELKEEYIILDLKDLKKGNRKNIEQYYCTDVKGLNYLTKWLDPKLTIDDAILEEIQVNLNNDKYRRGTLDQKRHKLQNYLISYVNIKNNQYWASRNPKTDNRLHTNLTNMPRFFRKHLRYEGKRLGSIDIKNSQPYFSLLVGMLINELKCSKGKENINDKEKNKINNILEGNMFRKMLDIRCVKGLQKELEELYEWVISGKFYENLIPYFKFEKKGSSYIYKSYCKTLGRLKTEYFDSKRDVMKKMALFFLYKSNTNQSDKNYNIFKKKFPAYCDFLEQMKASNSKLFPKFLQHVESTCLLDYTCRRISQEYPDVPLWTIHDSIITTVDNLDLVEGLMTDRIFEFCNGVLPQFEVEKW